MAELSSEQVALIEQGIVRSPYGKLLGVELAELAEDRVSVRMPYRPDLTTVGDMVHGGAISALVDMAATASFWASPSLTSGARGTTIGFSVNFLSAARRADLLATARVRRRGRSISTGEVSVTDGDGKEVAVALVTYKLTSAD